MIEQAADLLIRPRARDDLGDAARFTAQYPEAIGELVDYLKIPVMSQVMCRGLFADEDNPMFR